MTQPLESKKHCTLRQEKAIREHIKQSLRTSRRYFEAVEEHQKNLMKIMNALYPKKGQVIHMTQRNKKGNLENFGDKKAPPFTKADGGPKPKKGK